MSLYATAVRKPVTTSLIFIGIVVIGLFSLFRLPIDLYPKIETNTIMVITSYPGAGAADIETNVTKPLENVLNGVSNLKHIRSNSKENISVIILEFNEGTNINEATNDVRDKLDAVGSRLPDEVKNPVIFKFGSDDIPVQLLSIQADQSTLALYKILEDKVSNTLARIEGVGAVSIVGTVKREIQVYCDPIKLEAYHLGVEQVTAKILAENRDVPAGQVDIGTHTKSIRIKGEFVDPSQLGRVVVGSYNGRNVYLSDVARLEDTSAERMQEIYTNGKRGAMIVINKQSGANSVAISNAVRKQLPAIQKSLPSDVKLGVIMDTSDNIKNTIAGLRDTIFITFLVVMLVVLFFLGRWRATFIIILTIPISLVGAFIYLLITGNSLNIISLSSLSIAIGMVVDDAIVVLENITTHIERGAYPKQAAVHGTNEVGVSVIASTLTMLAVFLPLTMVSGMTGILFRQLGWIVSIIMIISTVAALSLTPMLSSQLLRRRVKPSRTHTKLYAPVERMLGALDRAYERVLHTAVRHRIPVIVLAVAIFGGSMALVPIVKTEFFPQVDNSYISATVELPVGTRTELSHDLAKRIYAKWRKDIPEIKTCNYSIGQADAENSFAATRSNGTNIISFNVSLVTPGERSRSISEIADALRKIIAHYPEVKLYNVIAGGNRGGAGGQKSVDVEIYGFDLQKTDEIARVLAGKIKGFSSCSEATISRKDYSPEYQVRFDRTKLAENGLSVSQAANYIRNRINGSLAGYYREDGDEYEIRVHLSPQFRRSLEDIENILIYPPVGGQGIRLRELGTVEETYMPPSIDHKDRQRIVTISGVVAKGKALSDLVGEVKTMMSKEKLPAGVSYKISGMYEDQQKSFKDLFSLMLLIIMLVFIVMAAEFESLVDPFVIMFAIPFAFTGVILGLVLTRTPLSVMAFVGIIILMGVVVKNGIVLIDYTRLCRERGMSILEAVVKAGRSRLRPVLMTTATTVLGMLPMAIGIGEGSEMWRSMGITIACGLTLSTLVTLVLVPTIYASSSALLLKIERRLAKEKRKRHAKEIVQ